MLRDMTTEQQIFLLVGLEEHKKRETKHMPKGRR